MADTRLSQTSDGSNRGYVCPNSCSRPKNSELRKHSEVCGQGCCIWCSNKIEESTRRTQKTTKHSALSCFPKMTPMNQVACLANCSNSWYFCQRLIGVPMFPDAPCWDDENRALKWRFGYGGSGEVEREMVFPCLNNWAFPALATGNMNSTEQKKRTESLPIIFGNRADINKSLARLRFATSKAGALCELLVFLAKEWNQSLVLYSWGGVGLSRPPGKKNQRFPINENIHNQEEWSTLALYDLLKQLQVAIALCSQPPAQTHTCAIWQNRICIQKQGTLRLLKFYSAIPIHGPPQTNVSLQITSPLDKKLSIHLNLSVSKKKEKNKEKARMKHIIE